MSSSDPQFAGAAIIPSSQKFKEEIYFFFSEINKTARVDEEPYRARIGRICTVRTMKIVGKPELAGQEHLNELNENISLLFISTY